MVKSARYMGGVFYAHFLIDCSIGVEIHKASEGCCRSNLDSVYLNKVV
jgi:hypothetical protein